MTEAHQIRGKGIDFDLMQITVRDGKGAKDRWVMLPGASFPGFDSDRQVHEAERGQPPTLSGLGRPASRTRPQGPLGRLRPGLAVWHPQARCVPYAATHLGDTIAQGPR
jgi:hypothetical protein